MALIRQQALEETRGFIDRAIGRIERHEGEKAGLVRVGFDFGSGE
jgi:hypothetical protein